MTVTAPPQNPLFHYNTMFDPLDIMRRFSDPAPVATEGLVTNFLGVKIPSKVFPRALVQFEGLIEAFPNPGNWHADIAEFGAALRAIDLAGPTFRMLELGCGWGCWMTNTGVAARRFGREVEVIGIEADPGHLDFAREIFALNDLSEQETRLVHGIAAPKQGKALFPRLSDSAAEWGSAPVFSPSEQQLKDARSHGSHDELDCHTIADLAQGKPIDLLHIDIQGGEVDVVTSCIADIEACVSYMVIGTHSRPIEGELISFLAPRGWELEIERPCIFQPQGTQQSIRIDGVQGWRRGANVK